MNACHRVVARFPLGDPHDVFWIDHDRTDLNETSFLDLFTSVDAPTRHTFLPVDIKYFVKVGW
jgi:hypothetical protein